MPLISSACPDEMMLTPGRLKSTPESVSTVTLKPPAIVTMLVEPTPIWISAQVALTPSSRPSKSKV